MIGVNTGKKVESKRHTIISGPPGIGKSYTTMRAIESSGANYIQLGAGDTESKIALQLAYAVNKLGEDDELIILIDDADDIVFGDYSAANRWKFAMAKEEPVYRHGVNLHNMRNKFEKDGRLDLAYAIDAFTVEGSVGIEVPMNRVRFVIICNANLEDSRTFRSRKIYTAVEAIVDRVKYKRLDFEWKVSWGWLAYVLENSQPFPHHPLSDEQKSDLANWLWARWEDLRNPSYRTVEEMAEYMINSPDYYEDEWQSLLKSESRK